MEDFYSNIYGSRISLARFAAFASHVCWLCAMRTAKHSYDSPTFKRVLSRSLRCKCPNRS
jgi:C4-type Zn-finger protein